MPRGDAVMIRLAGSGSVGYHKVERRRNVVWGKNETNEEPLQGLDRSCTWPIYILSHFIYSPGLMADWLISLPVRHKLLQAPGSRCCQGFWPQNGSRDGSQWLYADE